MKKLLGIGLVLALIGGILVYKMANKPLDKVGDLKTDFEVSAVMLLEAFENDEEAANKKYLDKAVVVSGKVIKSEVKNGITTIYLDADNPLSNIICQLENSSGKSVKENDEVRIKGVCTGYLTDVIINRAIIL